MLQVPLSKKLSLFLIPVLLPKSCCCLLSMLHAMMVQCTSTSIFDQSRASASISVGVITRLICRSVFIAICSRAIASTYELLIGFWSVQHILWNDLHRLGVQQLKLSKRFLTREHLMKRLQRSKAGGVKDAIVQPD